jgi:amino-acid N-acetyltransferase
MIEIREAIPSDYHGLVALVRAAGLPLDGLDHALGTAVVARDGTELVGCAALEIYGDAALLRSVAVADQRRGEGIGQRVSQAVLDLARRRGARRIYLLTQTAEGFFPRFGFRRVTRDSVDPAVRQSIEFRSACPDTAVVMVLDTKTRET